MSIVALWGITLLVLIHRTTAVNRPAKTHLALSHGHDPLAPMTADSDNGIYVGGRGGHAVIREAGSGKMKTWGTESTKPSSDRQGIDP